MPNITGYVGTGLQNVAHPVNFEGATGTFPVSGDAVIAKMTTPGVQGNHILDIDSSRVSSVYDSGATVRPAAVYTNWCIKC